MFVAVLFDSGMGKGDVTRLPSANFVDILGNLVYICGRKHVRARLEIFYTLLFTNVSSIYYLHEFATKIDVHYPGKKDF